MFQPFPHLTHGVVGRMGVESSEVSVPKDLVVLDGEPAADRTVRKTELPSEGCVLVRSEGSSLSHDDAERDRI